MAAVWSLCLALSGFSFWQSGAGGPEPPLSPPDLQAAAHAPLLLAGADQADIPPQPHRKLVTRPIEEIRPGMRVIAENPELDEHLPDTQMDRAHWRLVSVMREEEHGRFEAERLFPVSWLDENQIEVGSQVDFDLSEIELHGQVTVTSITDCPPLEADDGTGRRLVTAVFRHVADNVIDVTIDGEPEPIGCTSNHPFWSHDRQEFVEAGGLKLGEQVLSDDGTPRAITRITPHRGPPVVVYNFEVDVEHVYVVGDNGLLVHNSCSSELGADLTENVRPRRIGEDAAHIVPTGAFSGRQADVQAAIKTAQDALNDYLPAGARNTSVNGFWGNRNRIGNIGKHFGTHSDRYFRALGREFSGVYDERTALAALKRMKIAIQRGDFLD